MTWRRWFQSRILSAILTAVITPAMGAPAVFALGEFHQMHEGRMVGPAAAPHLTLELLKDEYYPRDAAGKAWTLSETVFQARGTITVHHQDLEDDLGLLVMVDYFAGLAERRGLDFFQATPDQIRELVQAAAETGIAFELYHPDAGSVQEALRRLQTASQERAERLQAQFPKVPELHERLLRLAPELFSAVVYGPDAVRVPMDDTFPPGYQGWPGAQWAGESSAGGIPDADRLIELLGMVRRRPADGISIEALAGRHILINPAVIAAHREELMRGLAAVQQEWVQRYGGSLGQRPTLEQLADLPTYALKHDVDALTLLAVGRHLGVVWPEAQPTPPRHGAPTNEVVRRAQSFARALRDRRGWENDAAKRSEVQEFWSPRVRLRDYLAGRQADIEFTKESLRIDQATLEAVWDATSPEDLAARLLQQGASRQPAYAPSAPITAKRAGDPDVTPEEAEWLAQQLPTWEPTPVPEANRSAMAADLQALLDQTEEIDPSLRARHQVLIEALRSGVASTLTIDGVEHENVAVVLKTMRPVDPQNSSVALDRIPRDAVTLRRELDAMSIRQNPATPNTSLLQQVLTTARQTLSAYTTYEYAADGTQLVSLVIHLPEALYQRDYVEGSPGQRTRTAILQDVVHELAESILRVPHGIAAATYEPVYGLTPSGTTHRQLRDLLYATLYFDQAYLEHIATTPYPDGPAKLGPRRAEDVVASEQAKDRAAVLRQEAESLLRELDSKVMELYALWGDEAAHTQALRAALERMDRQLGGDLFHAPSPIWAARQLADARAKAGSNAALAGEVEEAALIVYPNGEDQVPAAMGSWDPQRGVVRYRHVIQAYAALIQIAEGLPLEAREDIAAKLDEDTQLHELAEANLAMMDPRDWETLPLNPQGPGDEFRAVAIAHGLTKEQAHHLVAQLLDDQGREDLYNGRLLDLDPSDREIAQELLEALLARIHPVSQLQEEDREFREVFGHAQSRPGQIASLLLPLILGMEDELKEFAASVVLGGEVQPGWPEQEFEQRLRQADVSPETLRSLQSAVGGQVMGEEVTGGSAAELQRLRRLDEAITKLLSTSDGTLAQPPSGGAIREGGGQASEGGAYQRFVQQWGDPLGLKVFQPAIRDLLAEVLLEERSALDALQRFSQLVGLFDVEEGTSQQLISAERFVLGLGLDQAGIPMTEIVGLVEKENTEPGIMRRLLEQREQLSPSHRQVAVEEIRALLAASRAYAAATTIHQSPSPTSGSVIFELTIPSTMDLLNALDMASEQMLFTHNEIQFTEAGNNIQIAPGCALTVRRSGGASPELVQANITLHSGDVVILTKPGSVAAVQPVVTLPSPDVNAQPGGAAGQGSEMVERLLLRFQTWVERHPLRDGLTRVIKAVVAGTSDPLRLHPEVSLTPAEYRRYLQFLLDDELARAQVLPAAMNMAKELQVTADAEGYARAFLNGPLKDHRPWLVALNGFVIGFVQDYWQYQGQGQAANVLQEQFTEVFEALGPYLYALRAQGEAGYFGAADETPPPSGQPAQPPGGGAAGLGGEDAAAVQRQLDGFRRNDAKETEALHRALRANRDEVVAQLQALGATPAEIATLLAGTASQPAQPQAVQSAAMMIRNAFGDPRTVAERSFDEVQHELEPRGLTLPTNADERQRVLDLLRVLYDKAHEAGAVVDRDLDEFLAAVEIGLTGYRGIDHHFVRPRSTDRPAQPPSTRARAVLATLLLPDQQSDRRVVLPVGAGRAVFEVVDDATGEWKSHAVVRATGYDLAGDKVATVPVIGWTGTHFYTAEAQSVPLDTDPLVTVRVEPGESGRIVYELTPSAVVDARAASLPLSGETGGVPWAIIEASPIQSSGGAPDDGEIAPTDQPVQPEDRASEFFGRIEPRRVDITVQKPVADQAGFVEAAVTWETWNPNIDVVPNKWELGRLRRPAREPAAETARAVVHYLKHNMGWPEGEYPVWYSALPEVLQTSPLNLSESSAQSPDVGAAETVNMDRVRELLREIRADQGAGVRVRVRDDTEIWINPEAAEAHREEVLAIIRLLRQTLAAEGQLSLDGLSYQHLVGVPSVPLAEEEVLLLIAIGVALKVWSLFPDATYPEGKQAYQHDQDNRFPLLVDLRLPETVTIGVRIDRWAPQGLLDSGPLYYAYLLDPLLHTPVAEPDHYRLFGHDGQFTMLAKIAYGPGRPVSIYYVPLDGREPLVAETVRQLVETDRHIFMARVLPLQAAVAHLLPDASRRASAVLQVAPTAERLPPRDAFFTLWVPGQRKGSVTVLQGLKRHFGSKAVIAQPTGEIAEIPLGEEGQRRLCSVLVGGKPVGLLERVKPGTLLVLKLLPQSPDVGAATQPLTVEELVKAMDQAAASFGKGESTEAAVAFSIAATRLRQAAIRLRNGEVPLPRNVRELKALLLEDDRAVNALAQISGMPERFPGLGGGLPAQATPGGAAADRWTQLASRLGGVWQHATLEVTVVGHPDRPWTQAIQVLTPASSPSTVEPVEIIGLEPDGIAVPHDQATLIVGQSRYQAPPRGTMGEGRDRYVESVWPRTADNTLLPQPAQPPSGEQPLSKVAAARREAAVAYAVEQYRAANREANEEWQRKVTEALTPLAQGDAGVSFLQTITTLEPLLGDRGTARLVAHMAVSHTAVSDPRFLREIAQAWGLPVTENTRFALLIGGTQIASSKKREEMEHRYAAGFDVVKDRLEGVIIPWVVRDDPADVSAVLQQMQGSSHLVGAVVTTPAKDVVVDPKVPGAVTDEADLGPAARAAVAANLLVLRRNGTLFADANDGLVFVEMCKELNIPLAGQRVVVIGGGPAGRDVAASITKEGAASVVVIEKDPDRLARARDLLQHLQTIKVVPVEEAESWVKQATVLINASGAGMKGGRYEKDAALANYNWLQRPEGQPPLHVFDLIVNPKETPLLQAAAAQQAIPYLDAASHMAMQAVARMIAAWTTEATGTPVSDETVETIYQAMQTYRAPQTPDGAAETGGGQASEDADLPEAVKRRVEEVAGEAAKKLSEGLPVVLFVSGLPVAVFDPADQRHDGDSRNQVEQRQPVHVVKPPYFSIQIAPAKEMTATAVPRISFTRSNDPISVGSTSVPNTMDPTLIRILAMFARRFSVMTSLPMVTFPSPDVNVPPGGAAGESDRIQEYELHIAGNRITIKIRKPVGLEVHLVPAQLSFWDDGTEHRSLTILRPMNESAGETAQVVWGALLLLRRAVSQEEIPAVIEEAVRILSGLPSPSTPGRSSQTGGGAAGEPSGPLLSDALWNTLSPTTQVRVASIASQLLQRVEAPEATVSQTLPAVRTLVARYYLGEVRWWEVAQELAALGFKVSDADDEGPEDPHMVWFLDAVQEAQRLRYRELVTAGVLASDPRADVVQEGVILTEPSNRFPSPYLPGVVLGAFERRERIVGRRLEKVSWKPPAFVVAMDDHGAIRSGVTATRHGIESGLYKYWLDGARPRHQWLVDARLLAQLSPTILSLPARVSQVEYRRVGEADWKWYVTVEEPTGRQEFNLQEEAAAFAVWLGRQGLADVRVTSESVGDFHIALRHAPGEPEKVVQMSLVQDPEALATSLNLSLYAATLQPPPGGAPHSVRATLEEVPTSVEGSEFGFQSRFVAMTLRGLDEGGRKSLNTLLGAEPENPQLGRAGEFMVFGTEGDGPILLAKVTLVEATAEDQEGIAIVKEAFHGAVEGGVPYGFIHRVEYVPIVPVDVWEAVRDPILNAIVVHFREPVKIVFLDAPGHFTAEFEQGEGSTVQVVLTPEIAGGAPTEGEQAAQPPAGEPSGLLSPEAELLLQRIVDRVTPTLKAGQAESARRLLREVRRDRSTRDATVQTLAMMLKGFEMDSTNTLLVAQAYVDQVLADSAMVESGHGQPTQPPSGGAEAQLTPALVERLLAHNIRHITAFGPPGAGKGTQIDGFMSELNAHLPADQQYVKLVMGNYFRGIDRIVKGQPQPGDERYQPFVGGIPPADLDRMKRGELMSDQTAITIVNQILALPEYRTAYGIFFDGFPRTIEQLTALQEGRILLNGSPLAMDLSLILTVPDQPLLERIRSRAATEGRADDSVEAFQIRMGAYHALTDPMLNALRGKPGTIEVQGAVEEAVSKEESIRIVRQRMYDAIDYYLQQPRGARPAQTPSGGAPANPRGSALMDGLTNRFTALVTSEPQVRVRVLPTANGGEVTLVVPAAVLPRVRAALSELQDDARAIGIMTEARSDGGNGLLTLHLGGVRYDTLLEPLDDARLERVREGGGAAGKGTDEGLPSLPIMRIETAPMPARPVPMHSVYVGPQANAATFHDAGTAVVVSEGQGTATTALLAAMEALAAAGPGEAVGDALAAGKAWIPPGVKKEDPRGWLSVGVPVGKDGKVLAALRRTSGAN